ncbi:hypothetical protein PTKIN_Ptkin05aG0216300 [Pterospermum kingtungense]
MLFWRYCFTNIRMRNSLHIDVITGRKTRSRKKGVLRFPRFALEKTILHGGTRNPAAPQSALLEDTLKYLTPAKDVGITLERISSRLHKLDGIMEVNLLKPRLIYLRAPRLPKHSAIDPENSLPPKNNSAKLLNSQISNGMVPCNLLLSWCKPCSFCSLPIALGITPVNPFFPRFKAIKLLKLPTSAGILPLSLQSVSKRCSGEVERLPMDMGRMDPKGLPDSTILLKCPLSVNEEIKFDSSVEDSPVKLL